MVENFNKKIKNNVLKKYLFSSIFEMEEKIIKFVNEYNFEKKLKSLNYKTPEQFLKEKKDLIMSYNVSLFNKLVLFK